MMDTEGNRRETIKNDRYRYSITTREEWQNTFNICIIGVSEDESEKGKRKKIFKVCNLITFYLNEKKQISMSNVYRCRKKH